MLLELIHTRLDSTLSFYLVPILRQRKITGGDEKKPSEKKMARKYEKERGKMKKNPYAYLVGTAH